MASSLDVAHNASYVTSTVETAGYVEAGCVRPSTSGGCNFSLEYLDFTNLSATNCEPQQKLLAAFQKALEEYVLFYDVPSINY